jgi:membrane protease YdiL (CAAX protease family)
MQYILMEQTAALAPLLAAVLAVLAPAPERLLQERSPNWRYMILASIAGVAYGLVFRKSSTVLSSAALHMLVDWSKHFLF